MLRGDEGQDKGLWAFVVEKIVPQGAWHLTFGKSRVNSGRLNEMVEVLVRQALAAEKKAASEVWAVAESGPLVGLLMETQVQVIRLDVPISLSAS